MSDKNNSSSRGERDQRLHNKGQEDSKKGHYHKPHNYDPTGGFLTSKSDARDNDIYDDGYFHSEDQKDDDD